MHCDLGVSCVLGKQRQRLTECVVREDIFVDEEQQIYLSAVTVLFMFYVSIGTVLNNITRQMLEAKQKRHKGRHTQTCTVNQSNCAILFIFYLITCIKSATITTSSQKTYT